MALFNSVLVVCVGNICRSPLGEALFKQQFAQLKVASAGVAAMVGHAADAKAQQVAQQHGLMLDTHCARQLTPQLCREYELILVMEPWHVEKVCNIDPQARGKVMLLGKWLNERTIPDPYRQDYAVFEQVYELLAQAVDSWRQVLA